MQNPEIKCLLVRRKKIDAQQRALNNLSIKENRPFTPAEQKRWDELDKQFDLLTEKINRIQNGQDGDDSRLIEYLQESSIPCPHVSEYRSQNNRGIKMKKINYQSDDYTYDEDGSGERNAFNRYLKYGKAGLTANEFRALQSDKDSAGGFLTTPVQVVSELIKELDDFVIVRQLGRIFSVPNAQTLRIPKRQTPMGDPTWTTEIKTGSEDSDLDFEARDLTPHPLARRIKVSNSLLRLSSINPERIVMDEMTSRIASVLENGYISGTGSNQPLGMMTASEQGIDTDRDCATGALSNGLNADHLRNVVGMLKAPYRRRACWLVSREFETRLAKLKDGAGNYLWQAGLEGNPSRLLGFPLYISEYMPDTFSAGSYVGLFGDLSFYWIADAMDMTIKVLDQLYAETNQTGYICRMETDGMPVLSEAFVRIQLATS